MAAKKVAGWAAVIAVVPTLVLAVSGYLNVQAELAKVQVEQRKQATNQFNRDKALWDAYEDMEKRWKDCMRSAPEPAPPPPPAALATPAPPRARANSMKVEDLIPALTDSRTVKLDALAKQFGYVPQK